MCEEEGRKRGGEREGVLESKSVYLHIILISFCFKLSLLSIISHFLLFVLFQFNSVYFIYLFVCLLDGATAARIETEENRAGVCVYISDSLM